MRRLRKQTLWTLVSLLPLIGLCGVLVYGYVIRPRLQQRDTRAPSRNAQLRQRGREAGRQGQPGARLSEPDRAAMRARMVARLLEQAQLGDARKEPVKQALAAKEEARRVLTEQLNNLRQTAQKSRVTEQELGQALEAYRAALAQYRETMEAADAALLKQLPLSAQVRCTSLGILENGLGPMGMRGRFAGGPPQGGQGGPGAQGGSQGFGGRGARGGGS